LVWRISTRSYHSQSAGKPCTHPCNHNVSAADIKHLRQTLDDIDEQITVGNIEQGLVWSRHSYSDLPHLPPQRLADMVSSLDEYMDLFSYMSLTDETRRKELPSNTMK
jgi:hypothetical protein